MQLIGHALDSHLCNAVLCSERFDGSVLFEQRHIYFDQLGLGREVEQQLSRLQIQFGSQLVFDSFHKIGALRNPVTRAIRNFFTCDVHHTLV